MDPYQILGISANASDEEVKKAYREQARKYHPDNYHDNPLADLAGEKMKSVNEAYESILRMRGNGGNSSTNNANSYGGGTYGSAYGGAYGGTSGPYAAVRAMIARGDLIGAQNALNAMARRDAEWHFLMGSLFYRKGFLDKARQHIGQAVQMDPSNREYLAAMQQLYSGGSAYHTNRTAGATNAGCCDCCDCCSLLLCANCLCG